MSKTKFIKMFKKLPEEARRSLVLNAYGGKPMSLNVIISKPKSSLNLNNIILKNRMKTNSHSKKQNDMLNLNKANNSQRGERVRIRKEDCTNKISDKETPKSSLAINGDGNPADSTSQNHRNQQLGEKDV